jgi:hypothetical protein
MEGLTCERRASTATTGTMSATVPVELRKADKDAAANMITNISLR